MLCITMYIWLDVWKSEGMRGTKSLTAKHLLLKKLRHREGDFGRSVCIPAYLDIHSHRASPHNLRRNTKVTVIDEARHLYRRV